MIEASIAEEVTESSIEIFKFSNARKHESGTTFVTCILVPSTLWIIPTSIPSDSCASHWYSVEMKGFLRLPDVSGMQTKYPRDSGSSEEL
jgi:hypothetical protein